MGIHGLWPILESTAENVSLERLEGKKVAVDVSIWMHQASAGYAEDAPSPHVQLLIRRLAKLIFFRIRPVFVFDGPNVPVFKRRVLEERALRRHADDLVVTKEKTKHLEDLAKSGQDEEVVQKVLTKLKTSPAKKKRREDDAMFQLPSTSRAPLVDSESDEDEDDDVMVVVEKVEENEDYSVLDDVMALTAKREVMRQQRLRPQQVPEDSHAFCNFQMQRLLGRQRLNQRIDELKRGGEGERVVLLSKEGRKREHRIEWDEDEEVQVIEGNDARKTAKKKEDTKRRGERLQLTLQYLDDIDREEEEEEDKMNLDEYHDVQRALIESLEESTTAEKEKGEKNERPWYSKSGIIEDYVRKREKEKMMWSKEKRAEAESSSSDDSDLIDVPPVEVTDGGDTLGREKEWDPALDENEWMREGPSTGTVGVEKERSNVTEYRELQEVLSACGFPWVEAPGEAEAQCVWLQTHGLVDAVVSDDSDCFAFGVDRLVRHMFSKDKNPQYYERERIEEQLGLTRSDVMSVGVLSGGDYSVGVKGVGVVGALEMMAYHTEEKRHGEEEEQVTVDRLRRIEEWLLKEGAVENESAEKRKLRMAVQKMNHRDNIRGISDAGVVHAYMAAEVDESMETFRWTRVDVDRVKRITWKKLNWTEEKTQQSVMDAFMRWNAFMAGETSYQMHMSSWVVREKKGGTKRRELGKRMEMALQMMRERREGKPTPVQMEEVVRGITVTEKEDKKIMPEQSGRRGRRGGGGRRGGRGRGGVKRGGRGGGGERKSTLRLSSSSSSETEENAEENGK